MGSVTHLQIVFTDASPAGWGAVHEGQTINGPWRDGWGSQHIYVFVYLRAEGCFSSPKALSATVQGSACHIQNRQHSDSCVHQQAGGFGLIHSSVHSEPFMC